MLQYETHLNIQNRTALQLETDAIWNRFVHDVERAQKTTAIISASEPQRSGLVSKARSHNFVYEKKGAWRVLEPKEVVEQGLTDGFVKDFMARIDELFRRRHVNALLLYLSENWLSEVVDPSDPAKPPQKMDRYAILNTVAGLDELETRREVLRIEFSADRRRATVHSRETEIIKQSGKVTKVVSKTINFLEIIEQSVVLRHTLAEIQEMGR